MAKKRKKLFRGRRHKLLFYKHNMDRYWKMMMLMAIALFLIWFFGANPPAGQEVSIWFLGFFAAGSLTELALVGTIALSITLMLILLFLRNMAFIQVLHNHVVIASPFFRMKVPIKEIKDVKPTELSHLYDRRKMSKSHRFLLPYFGRSVISMSVKKYPNSSGVMNLFFPKHFFLPQERGFLLVIGNWLDFSTEFDSAQANYRQANRSDTQKESIRGLY